MAAATQASGTFKPPVATAGAATQSEATANSESGEFPVVATRSKVPLIAAAMVAVVFLLGVTSVGAYFAFFRGNQKTESKVAKQDLPDSKLNKIAVDRKQSGLPENKKIQIADGGKPVNKKPVNKKPSTGKKNNKVGMDKFANKKKADKNKSNKGKPGTNKKVAKKSGGPGVKPGNKKNPNPGKAGKGKKKTPGKKNVAGPDAGLPAPFSRMAPAVQLGPIVENPKPQNIGKVFCGTRALMGLQILVKPHVVPRNVTFTVERGENEENQTWTVSIKRKARATKIAKFRRDKDDLRFEWLPGASKDRSAGFLQNCVARLETRKTLHFLKLRKPFKIGELKIAKGQNNNKKELKLTHLPPGGLNFEVIKDPTLKLQTKDTVFLSPETRRQKDISQPIYIFPSDKTDARVYWIRIDLKVGRRPQIESRFMVAGKIGDQRGRPYTPRGLKNIVDSSQRVYLGWYQQFSRVNAYQPQQGEITKHKAEVSRLSGLLKNADASNKRIKAVAGTVDRFHTLALRTRIYFEIDGHKVDVATFNGKPVVYK